MTAFGEFDTKTAPTPFPFADDSTKVSVDAAFTLENGSFVDARLYSGVDELWYLSELSVSNGWLGLVFTGLVTGSRIAGATQTVRCDLESTAGVVLLSPAFVTATLARGNFVAEFDAAATTLVASAVSYFPTNGVTALAAEAGSISGDVWIIGEHGVTVRYVDNCIRIDFNGDPGIRARVCGTADVNNQFLSSVGGIPAPVSGMINIVPDQTVVDTILRVKSVQNGLVIYLAGV